ncbi:MAG TPA: 5'-3' exonuclease H3TH domain-containing protein [Vitreimonas sp.]|nr:5'-3' exonuclease H3TH domain-containing protein [Vitreimonas sp.]
MSQRPYFLIVDGHALIYRAYHAFPGLSTPSGMLVNAVYGFTRILLVAIRDFQPKYLVVTFDHPQPTFRHTDFVDYKANRVEMPDDLKPQIAVVKEVVTALNIPQLEVPGYEADDLIGTTAEHLNILRAGTDDGELCELQTIIVTGDRDAFQLVNEYTHVWMPGRGKGNTDTEYDRDGVKTKMGVYPEQIVDLKALMGDASDNIPGVAGVGEKTAVKLMQAFGTLEKLYQRVDELIATGESDEIIRGSLLEKLKAGRESAIMSQRLAMINREAPVQVELEACQVHSYNKAQATELLEKLEFKTLLPLLPADEFELGIQNALF